MNWNFNARTWRRWILGLGSAFLLGYALCYVVLFHPSVSNADTHSASVSSEASFTSSPFVRIAKMASPAVVNIDTETLVKQSAFPFPDDPLFREFFGQEMDRFTRIVPMRGKGSGFIVSKEGLILTNNHVVEGADKISVTLLDGRRFPAQLVGTDSTYDLAVIKIKAENLPVLPLGDSDKAEVGEWVIAIGNPFGLENSVTVGVISAKNRMIQNEEINFQGFMQTDAAINPGNSGGPLLNLKGEVVGINTAIVPFAQGIGFAIPVNMAKQVLDDLVRYGMVRRGWLGVVLQPVTPALAEALGIPARGGAIVSDIVEGSPGQKAGLRRGDVIVEVDGKTVTSPQDVVLAIRSHLAGEKATLSLYRQNKSFKLSVTLGEIPARTGSLSIRPSEGMGPSQPQSNSDFALKNLGLRVVPVSKALQQRYQLPKAEGVLVTGVIPESPADDAGFLPGDQILEVNGVPVRDLKTWNSLMSKSAKTWAFLVYRDSGTIYVSIKLS